MGNFYYGGITKKDWYNYTKDEILTQLILYDRHTIIKKKIAFETHLDIEVVIKQDNIKFTFQDVIVFDNIIRAILFFEFLICNRTNFSFCLMSLLIEPMTTF